MAAPALAAARVIAAAAMLAGCTPFEPAVLAGLPADLSGTGHPVAAAASARLGFDGYYRGGLALAGDARRCPGGPGLVPRDMLVVAGHATFGVNLPFDADVGRTGELSARYLDVGTLEGRFADGAFSGVLRADAAPACSWPVRLGRVDEAEAAEPMPDARTLR